MKSCPLSHHTVDENNARLQALWVVIVSVILLLTHCWILSFVMMADFILKSINPKLSFLSYAGKNLLSFFSIVPQPTNAGPKMFAAKIGATLMALITLFIALNWTTMTILTVCVILVCAFLEAAFNFCLGCLLYTLLIAHTTPPDYTI